MRASKAGMFMIIKEILARRCAGKMALTTFRINKIIRKTPIRIESRGGRNEAGMYKKTKENSQERSQESRNVIEKR